MKSEQHKIIITTMASPLGDMTAGTTDEGICLFDFDNRKALDTISTRIQTTLQATFIEGNHPYLDLLQQQATEYFEGLRKDFDLPLNLVGTAFQKQVWAELLAIPYAETRSYKQQAIKVGNLKAIRAVATANGENSIAIIVPCHRVIGSNGDLTGYGGGIWRKKWLLEHEGKYSVNSKQAVLFSE